MVISSTYEEKNPLMTKKTEEPKIVLLKRLSRIEGQVRGIMKMLEEDRDCVSIITQIAAVRSGIEGTGAIVLNNCMKICVNEGPNEIINLDNLSKAISIWGRVRSNDGV
jgi:DNA-binding FrmR family transcriptional regulator